MTFFEKVGIYAIWFIGSAIALGLWAAFLAGPDGKKAIARTVCALMAMIFSILIKSEALFILSGIFFAFGMIAIFTKD